LRSAASRSLLGLPQPSRRVRIPPSPAQHKELRDFGFPTYHATAHHVLAVSREVLLTSLPLRPWENRPILTKLYPCLGECIHHRSDGANLPLARRFQKERSTPSRVEPNSRNGVDGSTVLHFGNVNYRHMPLPRLIFQRRQLSGCRNQLTVPLLETRLCVHRGAGFFREVF
jgi:hypothetical protein